MSLLFSPNFSLYPHIYSIHAILKKEKTFTQLKLKFFSHAFWTISISPFFSSVTNILKEKRKTSTLILHASNAHFNSLVHYHLAFTQTTLTKNTDLLIFKPINLFSVLTLPNIFNIFNTVQCILFFSLVSRELFLSGFPPIFNYSFLFLL